MDLSRFGKIYEIAVLGRDVPTRKKTALLLAFVQITLLPYSGNSVNNATSISDVFFSFS